MCSGYSVPGAAAAAAGCSCLDVTEHPYWFMFISEYILMCSGYSVPAAAAAAAGYSCLDVRA